MADYLQAQDIADLVVSTRDHFWKNDYVDRTVPDGRQQCVAMPDFFEKNKMMVESGPNIEQRMDAADAPAPNITGLFGVDQANVQSFLSLSSIPWTWQNLAYAYDLREGSINTGTQQVLDLIRVRRQKVITGLWLGYENYLFGHPTSANGQMFGIGSYITVGTTVSGDPLAGGFTGGNPSGWTTGVGYDSNVLGERWKNFYTEYTDYSYNQLGVALQDCMHRCNFMSPTGDAKQDTALASNFSVYTNRVGFFEAKKIARSQNQNLGFDLDPVGNGMLFQGHKVKIASILGEVTIFGTNPFIGVNHNYLHVVAKEGWYWREAKVELSDQHNVIRFWIDNGVNLRCTNRNALFLAAKV